MLTKKIYEERAKIFKAFCDVNRLNILALLQNGEKCACELVNEMPIEQSTLSHHMKILCDAKIVSSRKNGKKTLYSLSAEGIKSAQEHFTSITAIYDSKPSIHAE